MWQLHLCHPSRILLEKEKTKKKIKLTHMASLSSLAVTIFYYISKLAFVFFLQPASLMKLACFNSLDLANLSSWVYKTEC